MEAVDLFSQSLIKLIKVVCAFVTVEVKSLSVDGIAMTPPECDRERQALVQSLLQKIHEQSRTAPERSPFWREGRWRCEFHRANGEERLKVFSGDRCVHEERVHGKTAADIRASELRRTYLRRTGDPDDLLD
jgi:hypothetical protein